MDMVRTYLKCCLGGVIILTAAVMFIGCNKAHQGDGAETVVDEALSDRLAPAVVTEQPVASEKTCREWPQRSSDYDTVSLEHPTVYFEDPFETCGSDDGRFGLWDKDSLISTLVSPVAFVGHVIMWPVSAVMAPPWENDVSRSREGFADGYALPSCASQMTAVDYPQPE